MASERVRFMTAALEAQYGACIDLLDFGAERSEGEWLTYRLLVEKLNPTS